MKLLAKSALVLLIITSLTSCLGGGNAPESLDLDKDFKVFKSKKFQIKVPDYLSETDDLNEDAEMQMQNMFKETYMIVMAESKSDFDFAREILGEGSDSLSYVENYMDMQLTSIDEAFDYDIVKQKTTHMINGMLAMTVEANGSIDGIGVSYMLTTVESDHDILYATCWTLQSKKQKYFPTFYTSLETLEQLEYDLESDESELQIDYNQLLKDLELEEGEQ